MKRITFKFVIGLMVITIAGAAFVAGCQLNSSSTTAASTGAQTVQNSTTSLTNSGIITQASAGAESISAIYSQASPAVVEINVSVQSQTIWGSVFTSTDQGSGFLIDTSGDIVTNNHVVEGANSIQIVLANGTTINNAHVISTDAADDLAVVNVSASAVAGITPLQFDDSGTVVPGQTVIAIGSPYGFMNSVTAGIISGVNRQITETDTYSGTYINISGTLQTDAAINPGNSGGPLLDTNGRVIGINTEIQNSSDGGIAFAVSSNTIQKALPALLKGTTVGASS